ncbi:class I SAM-dependent methyltransferase [Candidatus Latescibacterota bacterium]
MQNMKIRENIIGIAGDWVEKVWEEAVLRWSARSGQDKSYRAHVIYPALEKILNLRFRSGGLRILDLGCGDGIFLENPAIMQLLTGERAYLGIDVSGELLERAEKTHSADNIDFFEGDLSDSGLADSINEMGKDWNCALSVFAIQEIPDIDSVIRNIAHSIGSGAYVVLVTVHPDFAEWLRQSGKMPLADNIPSGDDISSSLYRWAGYYPIVDEPDESFYLPYFHRTIEDYENILIAHGILPSETVELPGKNDLAELVKQGISPFKQFAGNDYWPKICEQPSALAVIARKE